MLKIFYCSKCRDDIRQFGDTCLFVFEIICESFFSGETLEISTDIHDGTHAYYEIIRFLESKRLVITTESSENTIAVKPRGFSVFDDDDLYVCRFCIHEGIPLD